MGVCRMRIQFNGIIEKRSGGCSACGKRRTGSQFLASKTYYLPSGVTKMFRVGVPETVSEQDAQFLLQYRYQTPDGVKQVFEVV